MDPHFRVICSQWSSSITANRADNDKGRMATHEDQAKFWLKVQRGPYMYEYIQQGPTPSSTLNSPRNPRF